MERVEKRALYGAASGKRNEARVDFTRGAAPAQDAVHFYPRVVFLVTPSAALSSARGAPAAPAMAKTPLY